MGLNFEENIVLENERVLIEPLQRRHIEALLPIALKYPDLLKYSPPKFGTKESLTTYIEHGISLRKQHLKYPFAIYDKKKKAFAGSSSFMNISQKNLRLEIGSTWLGKEFQRTGLNRNCKFLMMQYVFEVLEYVRLEFKTDKRNVQSRKAIEQIGGVYEGALRSHTVISDGFRRDTLYYSVLRDEWPAIKSNVFKGMI